MFGDDETRTIGTDIKRERIRLGQASELRIAAVCRYPHQPELPQPPLYEKNGAPLPPLCRGAFQAGRDLAIAASVDANADQAALLGLVLQDHHQGPTIWTECRCRQRSGIRNWLGPDCSLVSRCEVERDDAGNACGVPVPNVQGRVVGADGSTDPSVVLVEGSRAERGLDGRDLRAPQVQPETNERLGTTSPRHSQNAVAVVAPDQRGSLEKPLRVNLL